MGSSQVARRVVTAAPCRAPPRASWARSRDLSEVVDRTKAAVLAPPVEDLLGRRRPHPVERVELRGRRAVKADRAQGRRRFARAAVGGGGLSGRTLARHDDLLSVCHLRREVDRVDVGPAARPARADNGVLHARAAAQPIDAGVADRARDVHERAGGRRALNPHFPRACPCVGRGRLARGSPLTVEIAKPEKRHQGGRECVGGQLRAGDLRHAPRLGRKPCRRTRRL